VGGSAYLAEVVEQVPTAANIRHYCEIVREKSTIRSLITSATEIVTGSGLAMPIAETAVPLLDEQDAAIGSVLLIEDRSAFEGERLDDIELANEGAEQFQKPFKPVPYCIQGIMVIGNKPTNNPFQPYIQYGPKDPVEMPDTIAGCQPGPGLFQVEAIPTEHLNYLVQPFGDSRFDLGSRGYSVFQSWGLDGSLSENYFNVDFMSEVKCEGTGGGPCVHATVGVMHPCQSGWSCGLWPNPTPKFQTRLYP